METGRVFPKIGKQCVKMTICGMSMIGQPETGSFIGLDKDGESFINMLNNGEEISKELFDKNKDMLNALSGGGYFEGQTIQRSITGAYLHVTSRCNLNCAGCYSYEDNRNAKDELSLKDIKIALEKLAAAGVVQLVISGGEPFLRDDLFDIVRAARRVGIRNVICITNGTATIQKYLKISKYLNNTGFSLDSHDSESACIRPSDLFTPATEKAKRLLNEGVQASLIFTLHKKNLKHMKDMEQTAKKLNNIPFNFSLFSVKDKNSEYALDDSDYNYMYELVKNHAGQVHIEDTPLGAALSCKTGCGAGRSLISISSNGNIYPCHMFNGDDNFCMGNILQDNLSDVLESEKNIIGKLSVDKIPECFNCDVKYLCGGGCRFRGYAAAGHIAGIDGLCKSSYASITDTFNLMVQNSVAK